jgi:chromosomal replication initiation ATPase DnaA
MHQAPGKKPAASVNDNYTFDYVAGEQDTQNDVFENVGKNIVDQCLRGYNGSIFAYGQTGSGKTFSIQGLAAAN